MYSKISSASLKPHISTRFDRSPSILRLFFKIFQRCYIFLQHVRMNMETLVYRSLRVFQKIKPLYLIVPDLHLCTALKYLRKTGKIDTLVPPFGFQCSHVSSVFSISNLGVYLLTKSSICCNTWLKGSKYLSPAYLNSVHEYLLCTIFWIYFTWFEINIAC